MRLVSGPVTINGRRYVTSTYDGTFPGPALVICPGDRVTVHLINDLREDTNLHVHGLHVSPSANSDNIFVDVRPGQRFTYQYRLPVDQDPGTFWYHPHRHMHVRPQIYDGLAGAIVVAGGLDNLLPNIPQRLMVIQGVELCGPNGRSVRFPHSGTEVCKQPNQVVPPSQSFQRYRALFVNGVLNPTVKIRPGEIQRWRIVNATDNRILKLKLQGQPFEVLAEDGNTLPWMRSSKALLIGPGSRREVLVRGGRPGRYPMRALFFRQFASSADGPTPNQSVLTLVSSGPKARDHLPGRGLSHPTDLRRRRVDRRRLIVFTQMETPMKFEYFINGRLFDPKFIAVTMKLNSVEEWTLVNRSVEWHTFHIHINPFQVISVNGRRVPYVDYQDNVLMPPHSRIVIRMLPKDFTGKFVMHCHVASHEDLGMMATVQVVKSPTPAQLRASAVASGGISIRSSAYGAGQTVASSLTFICHLLGVRGRSRPQ
ncbi:MAG TPA: multicopper oxidase family protein [Solirubrobacteraceae bacterium]